MTKEHRKLWKEVTEILRQARLTLNDCDGSVDHIDDAQFIEYLDHNELELALDEIEAISDSFELPREFWQCLVKASNSMDLKKHSKR
ncbi:MAG: hypothetical protein KUG81_02305 [Gammaproteobacteria bacterium]|nr:hypothetical protein [Gammaproteobacteria bacterium]